MSGEHPVAERLGERLRARGETLAVAESCTGGLLGSTVTSVGGASEYFVGGVVAYRNRAKMHLLAISQEALADHGAVSRPVAREMAQHVRDEAGVDWGLSTTGYAGPTTDGTDVPVGTIYVGIACGGDATGSAPWAVVERHQFDGDRATVKERAVERALTALSDQLRAASGSSSA